VRQKLEQKTNPIVVPRLGNLITPPQPGAALIPPKRDSLAPGYPALRDFASFVAFGGTPNLRFRFMFTGGFA